MNLAAKARREPPLQQQSHRSWLLASEIGLLAAAAVWAPMAFGASATWARFALELSAAAAVILWARSGPKPVWFTAVPLMVAGCFLAQLAPLPEWLLVKLAPVSAGAWKVSAAGMPGARSSISVDPAATWAGMRTLLISLAATAVVIDVGRLQRPRRALLGALAISGALILVVGALGGKIGEDQLMLGFIDVSGPILPTQSPINLPAQSTGVGIVNWVEVEAQRYQSDAGWIGGCVGTFWYGNHFAAAVCVTLPVLLSMWLWLSATRLRAWSRWLVATILAAAGVWAVGWLADSRAGAGALALTLATLFSLVAPLRWMRQGGGAAAIAMALGGAAFLVAILMPSETVLGFVPPDFKQQAAKLLADGRAGPAHVAMRAFVASPFLGTGLDTFQDVFPRFYADNYALFYAHNEYAQLLAETGLLGVALLGLLVWYLVPKAVRFWRDAPGDYRLLNAGPWAGLVGLTAHAAFDWDLHLSALALLAIVVIGICASSVPAKKPTSSSAWGVPEYVPRWMLVGCCVLAVAGMCRDAISETVQRQLREAIVADRLFEKDSSRPSAVPKLSQAISVAEGFQRWDSGDANLLVALGQADLHLARRMPSGAEKAALLGTAARWFQRARLASAMCRGLPEPVPVGPGSRRP
jgi:hypothetical protein